MNFRTLLNRAYNIVFHSRQEWNVVLQENASEKELFRSYALPWMLSCVSITAIFKGIYAPHFVVTFFITFVIESITLFGAYFLASYAGYYLISKLIPNSFTQRDITTLVTYASTIFWAIEILVAVVPEWIFAKCLSLAIAYVLWGANKAVVDIPEQKQEIFVVLLTLIIILVVPIIRTMAMGLLPNIHL